jgi:hypothetical protein
MDAMFNKARSGRTQVLQCKKREKVFEIQLFQSDRHGRQPRQCCDHLIDRPTRDRMSPVRRDISQRQEDKIPLGDSGVRQQERADRCRQPDSSIMIEEIEIKRPRTVPPPAPTHKSSLNSV